MMAAEIESVEQVYEHEFEKLKPQLIKWYKEGIIREDCNFTAWIGNKKYHVEGWDSFINLNKFKFIVEKVLVELLNNGKDTK
jgi:hypothetical protein